MKIGVYEVNPKPYLELKSNVSSVRVQKEGEDCVIIINTNDRWIDFNYKGDSFNPEAKELLERSLQSISFIFDRSGLFDGEADVSAHHTEVIVFAETEEEANLLKGIKYAQQDKDQITYLINPVALKETVELVSYRAEATSKSRPSI